MQKIKTALRFCAFLLGFIAFIFEIYVTIKIYPELLWTAVASLMTYALAWASAELL